MNQRKTHLDILRIFAIFLVIHNHTPEALNCNGLGPLSTCCVSLGAILTLMAVPLFFMISGALLLPKDEPLPILFRKRVLRFILIIGIFWTVQYAFVFFWRDEPWDFARFVELVACNGWVGIPTYVAWYLYAYLGLLLILPYTRTLARNISNTGFLYLFVLQFCFCWFLPAVYSLYTKSDTLPLSLSLVPLYREPGICPFSLMYGVFYMLLGYFLECRLADFVLSRKHLLALYSASIVIIAVSILVAWYATGSYSPGQLAYGCLVIPVASLFLIAKRIRVSSPGICKSLQTFSGAVLFVMLTENLFRILMGPFYSFLSLHIPLHLANLAFAILTCLAALCVGSVVKRFSGHIL